MSQPNSLDVPRPFDGFGLEIPFIRHLGVEMVRMQGGESRIEFEARPEHCNAHAMTHGGSS